jgi:serine/threonine protein kinase
MKTTYNGTYTQVDELESTEGFLILKQRLKDDVLKDSLVRANFLSGAHFLKTLKDSNLLTIDEVIESNEEVSVVCKNSGFQQLGLFLEDSSQLKDSYLVELISKMLNCLDSLHKNSIYHQGLNPNSFVVDPKGNVKLTLFGTLEHRLYHHFPAIGNENPSIQNAIRFYSPERKESYGVVNQSSEYYSFGLIIWYLLCVQRNLSSHRDLVLSFPDFSFTGSIWDNVLEACLNEDRKKRPKSAKEILALLPKVDEGNTVLKPKKEEIPASPKKVTISFFNYNSFHHEIKVDGNSIENYKYQISGRKLTIEVEEGVEFQVFMKKDGSFLTSFTSSKRWQYTLPGNFDEGRTYIPEPTKTDSKSKSNSILYIVIAVLLLVVLILLFRQCRKESNTTENASDNAISTEEIKDSINYNKSIIVSSCTAGSYIPDSYGLTYRPENINDGNINTWWSPKNSSADKRILLNLKDISNVNGIKIHGGSHFENHPSFGNLYKLNLRIKSLYVISYLNNQKVFNKLFQLNDLDEIQSIRFNESVKCDIIEINPISFYPTEKWQDVCISEIVVF